MGTVRNIVPGTCALFVAAASAIPLLAQAPSIGSCSVFPADSVWNAPVDQLPVAASSTTWVTTIGAGSALHPDFGAGTWNGAPIGIPFITVPGAQTKYPATFTYATESDPGPYAIPLNAPIEGGSQSTGDRHAIAIDTDNCILYELYAAYPQAAGWTAGSGAIYNLGSDALRPAGWTSADAAGLPIFPGLLRYDEIAAGQINHAIRFTVPQTQNTYLWPARHYASSLSGAQYPPMGTRFRLKAGFDISGFSAANQIILRALKKYGMILADNGSAWYISGAPDSRWNDSDLHALTTIPGSSFEAVDESSLMINPNSGQAKQQGVTVAITPPSATVSLGASQQFAAKVTNSSDMTVFWSVNGVPGGNATSGTISSSGLYVAPSIMPSPSAVTVDANSNSTPSAFGTATVTVVQPVLTVTISPVTATVQTGKQLQFTSNVVAIWKVNGITGGNSTVGTISAAGLYKAPASIPSPSTVTVTAVSSASPASSANAAVTIFRRR